MPCLLLGYCIKAQKCWNTMYLLILLRALLYKIVVREKETIVYCHVATVRLYHLFATKHAVTNSKTSSSTQNCECLQ